MTIQWEHIRFNNKIGSLKLSIGKRERSKDVQILYGKTIVLKQFGKTMSFDRWGFSVKLL